MDGFDGSPSDSDPSGPMRTPWRRALWAGFLLASLARAQQFPIKFERLSLEQGLSQNTVYDIFQDSAGFLWFATRNGLNRYDGYGFEVFQHDADDPRSLSHNIVNVLYEDETARLWIGTDGGLNVFDARKRHFTSYRAAHADSDSPLSTITAIVGGDAPTLWVGTRGGLLRFDPRDGRFEPFRTDSDDPRSLSHEHVRALLRDGSGTLWVGTYGDGLYRFDPEIASFTHYAHDADDPNSLSDDNVITLYEDHSGALWAGTLKGLNRLDRSGAFTRYRSRSDDPFSLSNDHITSLFEGTSGYLWVGTHAGGLSQLDRASEVFIHHQHRRHDPRSLGGNFVEAIFEDRSGVLWIGTQRAGISKCIRRGFTHYKVSATPEGNDIRAIYEDRSGRLWLGTQEAGLIAFDRRDASVRAYRHGPDCPQCLSNDKITAIHEDSGDMLWIGTSGGGLDKLDRRTGIFTHYPYTQPESKSGNYVQSIYEDRAGNLWIGAYADGISRYRRAEDTFRRYFYEVEDRNLSILTNTVSAIGEDSSGTLWLGTRNGLARLAYEKPEGDRFTLYRHDPSDAQTLSDNFVASIHGDDSGDLWVGTYSGLNKFDVANAVFLRYDEMDSRLDGVIYAILEGADGWLWMSTLRGLVRFNPHTAEIRTYNVHDGLQSNEFNRGARFSSHSGQLHFGGVNGFNSFHPLDIALNLEVPQVAITSFKVYDEALDIDPTEEIVLSYDETYLSIEYAALDFIDPAKNQYAFMLEGFDKDWIAAGARRFVTYTNLDPGGYVFRVKASNNDGVWNADGTSVRILVTPPFWRTWWFLSMSFLAVLGLVGGGHHLRLRSVRASHLQLEEWNKNLQEEISQRNKTERENERIIAKLEEKNAEIASQKAEIERFAYTFSHDLKSPLFTIRGFLGMVENDISAGKTERVKGDIQVIREASGKMGELLDKLLELSQINRQARKLQSVSLNEVAREAVAALADHATLRGVAMSISPELPTVEGDRSRLYEVFIDLIDNAIRYMGDESDPRVEVATRRDGEETVCYVRDNGMGIIPRYHERVFGLFDKLNPAADGVGVGLPKVRRIIEIHGGRIWIESEGEGRGCTVCFTLPQKSEPARSR